METSTAAAEGDAPRLGHLATEGVHPASEDLDALDGEALVRRLHAIDTEVMPAVAQALPDLGRLVDVVARALMEGRRLLYVGAGTSGRLAALDAVECQPTFGQPAGVIVAALAGGAAAFERAVEGAEDVAADGAAAVRELTAAGDVVVGVAASGRTPYVLGALAEARATGRATGLVCCAAPPGWPATAPADHVLLAPVGPEAVSGSTRLKAGTATKLLLNALSTAAHIRLGKVYRGRMVDVAPGCAKLVDRAQRIVAELGDVPRDRARALLEATGWRVKPAVLMARAGVALAEAERRLAAADGHLRRALAEV